MTDDDVPEDRDDRGRYRKGFSGNRNGRPRKKMPLSESDPFVFAQTLVRMGAGENTVEMTRREAVQAKLFQLGMKGNVRALIILRNEWAELDRMRAMGRNRLDELEREWLIEKRGIDVPIEVENEIMSLRSALNLGEDPLEHDPKRRRRLERFLRSLGTPKEDKEDENGESEEGEKG